MIEIIPAIDIIDGKCVRLIQGDYAQKTVYSDNPVEVARRFEDAGIKRLHIVDLDGAKAKHIVNYQTLEQIALQTKLIIDFGGGIKSDDDLDIAFSAGAAQVTVGSVAVTDRQLFLSWLQKFGNQKIILGADVKNRQIAITGWLEDTQHDISDFLTDYFTHGVDYVICTDISKDGMLLGASVELYRDLMTQFPGKKIIASGGVKSMSDIEQLEQINMFGVITGKALYEGTITLEQISNYIAKSC